MIRGTGASAWYGHSGGTMGYQSRTARRADAVTVVVLFNDGAAEADVAVEATFAAIDAAGW